MHHVTCLLTAQLLLVLTAFTLSGCIDIIQTVYPTADPSSS